MEKRGMEKERKKEKEIKRRKRGKVKSSDRN